MRIAIRANQRRHAHMLAPHFLRDVTENRKTRHHVQRFSQRALRHESQHQRNHYPCSFHLHFPLR
ncbi:hypothetical protein D3C78_1546660 [compost metagenome]